MSRLRITIPDRSGKPAPTNGTAYYVIYQAVLHQAGLIHGKLDNTQGEHCAIGSYFAQPGHCPLYEDLIDEVAMVNDSVPSATKHERKAVVVRWLKWKLQQCGFAFIGRPLKSSKAA